MGSKTVSFGECARLIRDSVDPDQIDPETPYIGLQHIAQDELRLLEVGKASDVSSNKYEFKKGDILFGKLRPYFRKVILAPFDGVCSTDIWVVRATTKCEQNFLFYWMASQEFVDKANQGSEGTKMPRAKWDFVSKITKEIPDLQEQKRISGFLKAFDDKIELNQRMIETLEAIARAIFKSWFVDFDPVHAKMAGEPYPLPDEIMALFPDELVESKMGTIPKGWEVTKLKDFIKIKNNSINPLEYPNNPFKYYSIPSYDKNKIPMDELGKNIKSRKYKIPKDSLLFSRLNPTTPRIWLPFTFGTNSICSTEFLVISPKTYIDKYFLYYLFSSTGFVNVAKGLVTGTSSSHQRVKQKDFLNIECLLADKAVIIKFSEFINAFLVTMNHYYITNENVNDTRDLLIYYFFNK